MPKEKKSISVKSAKYWGDLPRGYLELAKLGFARFKRRVKNKGFLTKDETSDLSKIDGNLLIASIWNVKHGLELGIKALNVSVDKHYDGGHDLELLFNDFKSKISELCLKRELDLLDDLVNKYHSWSFLKNQVFKDVFNDISRYTEGKQNILDYSFVHDITPEDSKQFLKDVYNISTVLSLLAVEIDRFISGSKLGIPKQETERRLLSIFKNPGYKV